MKARWLLVPAALVLLIAQEALAVKTEMRMSPKNLETVGFAVKTKVRDDGTVLVTVNRDTSKAHWPKRDCALEISESGRGEPHIVWCRLEPQKPRGKEKNIVSYEFIVSPKRMDDVWFTVGEVQTSDGTENGEQLIGGGDYYRFKLADFVSKEKSKTAEGTN
jgi:hypothetical protein